MSLSGHLLSTRQAQRLGRLGGKVSATDRKGDSEWGRRAQRQRASKAQKRAYPGLIRLWALDAAGGGSCWLRSRRITGGGSEVKATSSATPSGVLGSATAIGRSSPGRCSRRTARQARAIASISSPGHRRPRVQDVGRAQGRRHAGSLGGTGPAGQDDRRGIDRARVRQRTFVGTRGRHRHTALGATSRRRAHDPPVVALVGPVP